MPIVLDKKEAEIVVEAIECYSEYVQTAKDLLAKLKDNPDCTVWVIMTEEEEKKKLP